MTPTDGLAPSADFLDDGRFEHASGLQTVADRHGVGLDAVRHLLHALERGGGRMAQFDHPDLGGMGQWFSGGMVMVGRMFDDGLKARVDALCTDLATALPAAGFSGSPEPASGRGGGAWWPAGLGSPSSAGSQNGMRYAYFPETRRLAIETDSGVALYDTEGHHISGVSQSNGSLGFTGPQGAIALDRLRRIEAETAAPRQADPARPPAPTATRAAEPRDAPTGAVSGTAPAGDILATIERMAMLHASGVLTEREFSAKKAELLARL